MLLDHVRREVDRLNNIHEATLDRSGVALVRGWGHFLDARRLQVGEQVLRFQECAAAATPVSDPSGWCCGCLSHNWPAEPQIPAQLIHLIADQG